MKKLLFVILWLSLLFAAHAQNEGSTFKAGEWLKFRLHYGWLNASYATLHLTNTTLQGKNVYHVVGKGKTTGLANVFFKVDDLYETYFDKESGQPYRFIRKIDEGGYTKNVEINFDYVAKQANLVDKKRNKTLTFDLGADGIQDLLSAFYYLRNHYDEADLQVGKDIQLKMLYDKDGIFLFRLRFLGTEILDTKYGKIQCYKFRPFVQSGRVFKEQESLSLWVTTDKNRIPVRVKADLVVGSIKADLDGYNGLKHQLEIIMD